jgi:hypothetical protein
MKRFLTILFVLAFATSVYAGEFGWSLSDSATDYLANTGTPVAGLVTIYLWYACTNNALGLASAEFDVAGTTVPLSFTTANGFLNAGGATNLLLAVGGCPAGPVYAGTFLVFDAAGLGFNLCIVESATPLNCSVNCVDLQIFPNDYIGYTSDGTVPCTNVDDHLCETIAVESTSWGNVKSLYR